MKTNEKYRKKVIVIGSVFFLYFIFVGIGSEGEKYFVDKVIDGDTFETSNGKKVRLIGFDTPESKHPNYGVQKYAMEAAYGLQSKILNKTVEIDINDKSKYGRALGYVYLNGESVNEYVIKEGFGRSYRKYPHKYNKLEIEAKGKNKGMWQYY